MTLVDFSQGQFEFSSPDASSTLVIDKADLMVEQWRLIEMKVLGSPVKVLSVGEKYDSWFRDLLGIGKIHRKI